MNRLNTKILVVSTRCDHMIKQTAMKQQRRELKESVERETSEPRGPRLPPLVTTPKDGVMFLCHFVLPSTTGVQVRPPILSKSSSFNVVHCGEDDRTFEVAISRQIRKPQKNPKINPMRRKIDQKTSLDLKSGKKKKPYTLTIGNGLVWFERVQSEPFTIFET